jgi:hypothetical protein
VEKPASVVVTIGYGLLAGKVGSAAATGPVMNTLAASAVFEQPPEVRTVGAVVSEPTGGVMVRLPNGAALATPPLSNPAPAVTATTRAPDASRVKNLYLCTI